MEALCRSDHPRNPPPADWTGRHRRDLWLYLRHLGAEPETADDLTQEAFLVALRRGFEPRSDAETAVWLRQTAQNLFRNDLRRRRRTLDEGWLEAVDQVWAERPSDRLDRLAECMQQLPPRARQAVEEFYGEGRSRADVAARLGLRENGLKTMLQRIRATLRRCIEGETRP